MDSEIMALEHVLNKPKYLAVHSLISIKTNVSVPAAPDHIPTQPIESVKPAAPTASHVCQAPSVPHVDQDTISTTAYAL
jgi:hypothetical protein